MTLVGSHIESILEEDLPSKFGGSPPDYQLIEEEDEQGFTRLTILVNPAVAIADEQAVVAEMHAGLRRRGGAAEMSRELWKQADAFRVRREAPRLTSRGKMMPLQLRSRESLRDEAPSATAGRDR